MCPYRVARVPTNHRANTARSPTVAQRRARRSRERAPAGCRRRLIVPTYNVFAPLWGMRHPVAAWQFMLANRVCRRAQRSSGSAGVHRRRSESVARATYAARREIRAAPAFRSPSGWSGCGIEMALDCAVPCARVRICPRSPEPRRSCCSSAGSCPRTPAQGWCAQTFSETVSSHKRNAAAGVVAGRDLMYVREGGAPRRKRAACLSPPSRPACGGHGRHERRRNVVSRRCSARRQLNTQTVRS